VRVVAWNCGAGFHRKAAALAALRPDVAVVGECCAPEILARKAEGFVPSSVVWAGGNPNKGLAVLAFGRYRLELAGEPDATITYALPVRVSGPVAFNLLGLWAHHPNGPPRVAEPGPTLTALRRYGDFLRERPAIVAGDFNNHPRWDRPGKSSNHANAVAALAALGLISAYHAFCGLAPGAERHPTLYWRDRTRKGPSYHIDYVFMPEPALPALRRIRVGRHHEWVASGLSDHVPLILDLDPGFAQSPP
jgi:exodeoxyribonuclease-3